MKRIGSLSLPYKKGTREKAYERPRTGFLIRAKHRERTNRLMRLHLRFLRKKELIQEALRADGWQLERERDDCISAQHPLVKDEITARIRLQDLGLLTSASVYIQFIRARQ